MAREPAAGGGPAGSAVYLIRTPLREHAGMLYGGPLRVRAGRRTMYAGFTSVALAREVCEYWRLAGEVHVEPWEEAVRHDAPEGRPSEVLLFRSRADFDSYLREPAGYPRPDRRLGILARAPAAPSTDRPRHRRG